MISRTRCTGGANSASPVHRITLIMTSIDTISDNNNLDRRRIKVEAFFTVLRDLVTRHTQSLNSPIFALSESEKQVVVDKINPYIAFELKQTPDVKGALLTATGYGLMLISTPDGTVIGAEVISHGDIITGRLNDACVLPVPTVESLLLGDADMVPIVDQTLSGVVLLEDACYKTGQNLSGDFEVEHDLSNFQIGLALNHQLSIVAEDN